MNQENLRTYIRYHNPQTKKDEGKKAKTFNISGIESKLNLPSKLIDNFISDRDFRGKSLGDYKKIVFEFFTELGYDDDTNYSEKFNQFL